MSESTGSSSLWVRGDSNVVDDSAILEELLDGPSLGSESEVANEDGSGLCTSTGWSWGLSGEIALHGVSVKISSVRCVISLSSSSVVSELNECLALGLTSVVEKFALYQLSESSEVLSKTVLVSVVVKSLDEELGLSGVLILDGSNSNLLDGRCLSGGLLGNWLFLAV